MGESEREKKNTIEKLLKGARSFRKREYGTDGALMPGLADGQRPGAMMIACADSRVDPALLFDARPGELLVVRAVANLVPPPGDDDLATGVMAAVELALQVLKVSHLIVCGHSNCAGVRTALDSALQKVEPDSSSLQDWTSVAEPVCHEVIAEIGGQSAEKLACHAERRSILKSLENLRSHTWLRELETSGKLTLHGWWFDIATGDLWIADPESGDFTGPYSNPEPGRFGLEAD